MWLSILNCSSIWTNHTARWFWLHSVWPSGQRDSGPAMGDFSFENRSCWFREAWWRRVDDVKTEYSKDDVPLDDRLAERCKLARCFILPARHRLVFANPVTGRPYHQESLRKRQLQRAAKLAGWDGHWMAHIPPYLSLLARRNGCSDEGAAGTDASRFDPDDDECLWAGHDGNQTPGKQSGCRLVFGPNSQHSPENTGVATVQ